MNQLERLLYLNEKLLEESPQYKDQAQSFRRNEHDQFALFRALCNIRDPKSIDPLFLEIQDEMLKEKISEEKIVDISLLLSSSRNPKMYLWQGDITRLNTDAIVNAANSQMLGCFIPGHNCIDNIIHTKAGIQLRLACHEVTQDAAFEPVGKARITPAFNLPSQYVIHTVGPQIHGSLRDKDIKDLQSCYLSVLQMADQNHLQSLAFCCISTGVFHFPNDIAARIAVETVESYLCSHPNTSLQKIIFNVFKDEDRILYEKLLK